MIASLRVGSIVLLLCSSLMCATGHRHDCAVSGRPRVGFAVPSCCGGQSRYYWDDRAKDCVELPPRDIGLNCGCVCKGECARLYWTLAECRSEYRHCQ